MPGIIHIIGCCCKELLPCTDCAGNQPDAMVTIAGTCGDAECEAAAGTYKMTGDSPCWFSDGGLLCGWNWCKDGDEWDWQMGVVYEKASKQWCAVMIGTDTRNYGYRTPLTCTIPFYMATRVTGEVTCDKASGKLVGTFELVGDEHPEHDDCAGCTATITLNP